MPLTIHVDVNVSCCVSRTNKRLSFCDCTIAGCTIRKYTVELDRKGKLVVGRLAKTISLQLSCSFAIVLTHSHV